MKGTSQVFHYSARIMARLGTDDPIELFRTPAGQLALTNGDIRTHTSHLGQAWSVWIERRTPERDLVGPRPVIRAIPSEAPDRVHRAASSLTLTPRELGHNDGDAPALTFWD